ncbi:MAG: hypothetical protein R3E39_12460 [Anaerolineae bacterium]
MNTTPQSEQYSRVVEFETPLTPAECCTRLNKLPKKMAYLKAKSQFGAPGKVGIRGEMVSADRCDIVRFFRNDVTYIGHIESGNPLSRVYIESRPKLSRPLRKINTLGVIFLIGLYVVFFISILVTEWRVCLCFAAASTPFLVGLITQRGKQSPAFENLLQIVLTESDEYNL